MREYAWPEIEGVMKTFAPAEGGYSDAARGFVTLRDGRKVFVKMGTSEYSKQWTSKEVSVYDFLAERAYIHVPKLLAANEDGTSFALEALRKEDGWDWASHWSDERLNKTLAAMDALAALEPDSRHGDIFKPVLTDDDNGWLKLLDSEELQSRLALKLRKSGEAGIVGEIPIHAERSARFAVRHEALVHDDVRADNCAWNGSRGTVKLIDWNWLEMGDRRIDLAAMLVHVQSSGFDVLPRFAERLDADALHWISGFWFASASKPIWPGGPEELREVQLRSAVAAFRLAGEMKR
jgi:hypothetical protein